MSWEHLHLVTHPFPVVLAAAGVGVGLAGWIAGRESLEDWALKAFLLAGAAAPVAYYTGIAAADTAARRTFVAPSLVQTHRSWATWATILLVTMAIFAAFALWQDRGRPEDRRLRRFVLLIGIGAVGLAAYAAWLGGGIVHRGAGPDPSGDGSETSTESSGLAPEAPPSHPYRSTNPTLEIHSWHPTNLIPASPVTLVFRDHRPGIASGVTSEGPSPSPSSS